MNGGIPGAVPDPPSEPLSHVASLKAAARRGDLSAEALATLFEVIWHGFDALAWDARHRDDYSDTREALVRLEAPLMRLVSALEDGPARPSPRPDRGEARLDRIQRAQDMNATFHRLS